MRSKDRKKCKKILAMYVLKEQINSCVGRIFSEMFQNLAYFICIQNPKVVFSFRATLLFLLMNYFDIGQGIHYKKK